jgi:hypothetical protein
MKSGRRLLVGNHCCRVTKEMDYFLGDESDDSVNPFAEYFHMLSERSQGPYNFYYNDLVPLQQQQQHVRRPTKRVPGSEFLGKRVPGSEFLGKRVPGSEFLGKRVPGSEFLGKRVPGSEFLGKRAPGSEFLGKRAPGSEFLGKRSISYDENEDDEMEIVKKSPEFSSGISQSDRDNYFKGLAAGLRR